jgi:hypothetical protein
MVYKAIKLLQMPLKTYLSLAERGFSMIQKFILSKQIGQLLEALE